MATFDDMRRDSFEDQLPDMVKYKDIRGHPDGTESRSNTQTSEQKESGYFSNPRSTSSKNHGMQLPTSNRKVSSSISLQKLEKSSLKPEIRAVTASERKLTGIVNLGNRRQTFQHISASVEVEDESETKARKSQDKATFLHRPIFDNHRRRTTVVMDSPVIEEVTFVSSSDLTFVAIGSNNERNYAIAK